MELLKYVHQANRLLERFVLNLTLEEIEYSGMITHNVKNVQKSTILVMLLDTSCPFSDKVETVDSCPQTAVEWKEATARKSCKNILHNCSSLEYHCVINAWQNETIEVCAPKVLIVGKVCAEFNFGGNRIQRNHNATCEKCPVAYNSSNAFMYTECYEYVERIVIGLSVTVVIVLIISSVLLLIRRRRRRHKETRDIHVCSAVKRHLQEDHRSEDHLLTADD
uniref:Uncharacterized protein n=1 Tax=Magallana gigas TaxID=29159 RepID=A0A8W8MS33_MAGGI